MDVLGTLTQQYFYFFFLKVGPNQRCHIHYATVPHQYFYLLYLSTFAARLNYP